MLQITGVVMLIAMGIGGDLRSGVISLGILTGFGALLLFGGRSETIRGGVVTEVTSGAASDTPVSLHTAETERSPLRSSSRWLLAAAERRSPG